jgi:hypothetical protein
MFDNFHYFVSWIDLFAELFSYSVIVSMAFFFLITLFGYFVSDDLRGELNIKEYFSAMICVIGLGLFGYLIGTMSSLSRETGAPALIGALVPAIVGAFLMFNKSEVRKYYIYVAVSVIFVTNLFCGIYIGASLRVDATTSLEALQKKAYLEFQIRNFRNNLGLPNSSQ